MNESGSPVCAYRCLVAVGKVEDEADDGVEDFTGEGAGQLGDEHNNAEGEAR